MDPIINIVIPSDASMGLGRISAATSAAANVRKAPVPPPYKPTWGVDGNNDETLVVTPRGQYWTVLRNRPYID